MASKLTYDIGYFMEDDYLKLRNVFREDLGRKGIVVTANLDVPDPFNILVTIESDSYPNKILMLDMFANILAVELLDQLQERKTNHGSDSDQ